MRLRHCIIIFVVLVFITGFECWTVCFNLIVFISSVTRAVFTSVINTEKFECPTANGSFPHSTQCDKYYVCKDGVPEEILCSDGLVFNMNLTRAGKCDQLFNVDCGNRSKLRKFTTSSS